jgi:hypothetical protein
MRHRRNFAEAEHASKNKQTLREKFLAEMERVVPWARQVEHLSRSLTSAGWPVVLGDFPSR